MCGRWVREARLWRRETSLCAPRLAQVGIDKDAGAMATLEKLTRPKWPLQGLLEAVPEELLARLQPELVLLPEVIEHVRVREVYWEARARL
jgi:hypothetical protein